jgi:hypothetical protein
MKRTTAVLLALGSMMVAPAAFGQKMNADDLKWVNQCIDDNKGGAGAEIIRKYCICMNEKMDDNETKSITQWEKTHPAERTACDKASGWK